MCRVACPPSQTLYPPIIDTMDLTDVAREYHAADTPQAKDLVALRALTKIRYHQYKIEFTDPSLGCLVVEMLPVLLKYMDDHDLVSVGRGLGARHPLRDFMATAFFSTCNPLLLDAFDEDKGKGQLDVTRVSFALSRYADGLKYNIPTAFRYRQLSMVLKTVTAQGNLLHYLAVPEGRVCCHGCCHGCCLIAVSCLPYTGLDEVEQYLFLMYKDTTQPIQAVVYKRLVQEGTVLPPLERLMDRVDMPLLVLEVAPLEDLAEYLQTRPMFEAFGDLYEQQALLRRFFLDPLGDKTSDKSAALACIRALERDIAPIFFQATEGLRYARVAADLYAKIVDPRALMQEDTLVVTDESSSGAGRKRRGSPDTGTGRKRAGRKPETLLLAVRTVRKEYGRLLYCLKGLADHVDDPEEKVALLDMIPQYKEVGARLQAMVPQYQEECQAAIMQAEWDSVYQCTLFPVEEMPHTTEFMTQHVAAEVITLAQRIAALDSRVEEVVRKSIEGIKTIDLKPLEATKGPQRIARLLSKAPRPATTEVTEAAETTTATHEEEEDDLVISDEEAAALGRE